MTDKGSSTDDGDRLRPFRVGEWQVWPERNELLRGGDSTRVQPRLIQVLRLLAAAAGRTVTRETLLEEAWSRRMVNDEVLSRTIADLRQALGDDARQPRYLETIPKVGYRLLAEVEWLAATSPALPAAAPPAPADAVDRVADTTPSSPAPAPAPARRALRLWTVSAVLAAIVIVGAAALIWTASRRPATRPASDWSTRLLRAQPLTSDPGWELTPRFAHRADLIAYSQSGPEQSTATIWLRSRDGRIARAVSDGSADDVCPVFSADDAELIWTRHLADACQILRAPVLGGAPVTIARCATGVHSCPDWSGDALIYTAPPIAPGRGAGLARLQLHDGTSQPLTDPPAGDGNDTHPRVAGDGRIVYSRGVESDRQLMVYSARDGERRIPFAPSMIYGQLWLPDGRVLVASDGLGFRALLAVQPDTGASELFGARGARYPDLANDGALAFEQATFDANLWQYLAGGAAPRQLTSSLRYDAYPRIAPDGTRVLYQSNRDGPESLYVLDLRSQAETRLPLDPTLRWAQPSWASDGRRIALTRYAPNGVDLWQYTLGSDAPTRLIHAPAGAHDGQLDSDGLHAWCRVGNERVAHLLRFALDGATPAQSRPEIVEHYQIDAQGLFMVLDGDDRLHHCADPLGAACVALPVKLDPGQRRNWAIADDAVYYVADEPGRPDQISRYRLSDGDRSTLPWPRPGALSRAIDVSRDGRMAIIARTDRVDVDLQWLAP